MAAEEEVELRDLVAHTLETRGVLGKIRAQLRASVFLALEEQESQEKPHPLVSSRFQQYLKTKEGVLATALVREFLSYFELDYTCSVFDPETNALETYPGRDKLASDLGLNLPSTDGPLISQLLHRPAATTTATAVTSSKNTNNNSTPSTTVGSLSTATPFTTNGSLTTSTPSSIANHPTTVDSLSTAADPVTSAAHSITTAFSPLDTTTITFSSRTVPDGDRQPFSTHHGTSAAVTTTPTSSTATGTTTTTANPHWENSDGISQVPENALSRPANSFIDTQDHPGGGGGGGDRLRGSDHVGVAQDDELIKDDFGISGLTGGGMNSKGVDVTGNGRDSSSRGGGSGPPKNRSISLTPQVIKPSTNGMVGNGEAAGSSKAGTTWQDGLHHANNREDKDGEDSPISEDLSNSEENTDDFFGTKSSRGGSSNKVDYSYEDDFHSENSKSETKSKSLAGLHNKYEETEDCTVSESSFGTEVDYMEPVKS